MVLADTHLRAAPDGSFRRWLPTAAEPYLESADVILHAGDLLDAGVIERLRIYAPVHAVLGNNDVGLDGRLPLTTVVSVGGVRIGMIHDSGPARGRPDRLERRFPDADAVVFGHSHAPVNETAAHGQLLFNPGSPTQRRAQPCHTLGQLVISDGVVVDSRIVELD